MHEPGPPGGARSPASDAPGADHRAERLGQGEAGRDRPGQLAPQGQAVREGQRRRAARRSARGRAVRRRGGRVHRRQQVAHRAVRGGPRRHAVPRRDRHPVAGRPGQAAARAADGRVRAPRVQRHAQGRRAHRQRHQHRPAARDRRRAVPRGSLLPPQRHRAAAAAAGRAPRRHAAAGRALPGELAGIDGAPPAELSDEARATPADPRMAGQRARAAEPHPPRRS